MMAGSDNPPAHAMAHVVAIAAGIPRHAYERLGAALGIRRPRHDLNVAASWRGERV